MEMGKWGNGDERDKLSFQKKAGEEEMREWSQ